MLSSKAQRQKIDDDFFQLALLGLLEIEGRELICEEKRLKHEDALRLPAEMERAAHRRIRRREMRNKVLSAGRHAAPVVTKAAVFFFVLFLGLNAVLAISVQARESFYRLLISSFSRYTQVEYDMQDRDRLDSSPYLNLDCAYAPTNLPDGFSISHIQVLENTVEILYQNMGGGYILFSQTSGGKLRMDSEDADSESIPIGDSEALLVEKNGRVQIVWQTGRAALYVKTNIPRANAIRIAQEIKPLV